LQTADVKTGDSELNHGLMRIKGACPVKLLSARNKKPLIAAAEVLAVFWPIYNGV
jgi:hypothetical protein